MSKQIGPTKRTMEDNDIKMKMAMDDMAKEDGKCVETSSPLFQEIWAMVDGYISVGGERAITEETYPNQIKTQEKEGGEEEANVKVNEYDEEVKQSTMLHEDGQTNEVNSKVIPWYLMTISNLKEETIINIKQSIVNSHMRVYHEKGRRGKNAMWSSKGLNVSMHLRRGCKERIDQRTKESQSSLIKGTTKRRWHMCSARTVMLLKSG